jgi:hypothetical protein
MDFLERIRQEARVIKSAPFSFIVFLVAGATVGYIGSSWYYSKQIIDKDGQIGRYRVALGIDPASKGALVELNNQELALKAQSTVAELRKLSSRLDARWAEVQKQVDAKKLDGAQAFKAREAFTEEVLQVSQDFDRNLASDTYNLRNELHKRLDSAAIAHIPRVPSFKFLNGAIPLDVMLRNTGADGLFIRQLADEIEQLAKLLPPDYRKP